MNKIRLLLITVMMIILLLFVYVIPSNASNEATGFTVMSISSSVPLSNIKALNEANFTLTIATGGGQSVVGTFGNETFSKFLINMILPYPLKIEMGEVQETIEYPILNHGMIFEYTVHTIDAIDLLNGAKCDNSTYCFPVSTGRLSFFNYDRIIAVNKVPIGMYGSLGNPDLSWKGKMVMTINGIPYTQTIGSGNGVSGSINFNTVTGKWIATAKGIGGLVTGQSVPSPYPYVPIYTTKNKVWTISSRTKFDSYIKSLTETDTIFSRWKDDNYGYYSDSNNFKYVCKDVVCSEVINYITVHNANLKALIDSNEQIRYESGIVSDSKIITKRENDMLWGNVVNTLPVDITNQVITITIAAKELHVLIPVGIPEIESIESLNSSSGDGGSVTYIKVKNVGDAKGTFAAYLTDNTGIFTSSGVESAKITLDKGETGTILMFINHGTNLNVSGLVNITVYDVNFPDDTKVSKNVNIVVDIPKVCKSNEYRVYASEVYKCNDKGTDESLILKCNEGIIKNVDGSYICEKVDINSNPDFYEESVIPLTSNSKEVIPEKPKEVQKDSIFMYVLYGIIGFFLLTSIFIVVNKYRNEDEKVTKTNIDKSMLLSGIIVGILFIIIQFAALNQSLGITLWFIIIFILAVTLIINGVSYVNSQKILPYKVSIIIVIVLFIIVTAIASNVKDMMCGNVVTSRMFSNCEQFSLKDFIFK